MQTFESFVSDFLAELSFYDIASVAESSGVHFTTLYCWLRGQYKPSLRSVLRVAPVIGLDVELHLKRPRVRAVN